MSSKDIIEKHVGELTEGRKLLFMCSVSWCDPCRRVKPAFTRLGLESQDVEFYYIELDSGMFEDFVKEWDITAYPTFLGVSYSGGSITAITRVGSDLNNITEILESFPKL